MHNEDKNEIVEKTYDVEGLLIYKCYHQYNVQGNLTEKQYVREGSLGLRCTYSYDINGNKTEEINYDSDGSLTTRTTYLYDEEGYLIKKNVFNENDIITPKYYVRYKYDIIGNWVNSKKYYFPNTLKNKTVRKFKYYEN